MLYLLMLVNGESACLCAPAKDCTAGPHFTLAAMYFGRLLEITDTTGFLMVLPSKT
jgi:hypothetical protein